MCGVIFFYLKKLFGYDHHHSLPSAKQNLKLNKTHSFSTNYSNPSVPTTQNFSTCFNTPQTFPGSSRSSHSHAVCNKLVLSHSTSRHAKGSGSLYVIPEDIKCLIKQDIVPQVLKKPMTPQTYKDYFATLLYAEDFYLQVPFLFFYTVLGFGSEIQLLSNMLSVVIFKLKLVYQRFCSFFLVFL